jgi:hypothetical protein
MTLSRRDALPLVAGLLASPLVCARAEVASAEISLWPGPPPGGDGPASPEQIGRHGQVIHVHTPRLILHRPAQPNGTAVIVVSGYHSIELGKESTPTAGWLASQGVPPSS